MKEHPIIFNTENVRAILDGRKTQTRRIIKPQPTKEVLYLPYMTEPQGAFVWRPRAKTEWYGWQSNQWQFDPTIANESPYGQAGDRLWVRETWRKDHENPIRDRGSGAVLAYEDDTLMYKADKQPHIVELFKDWKPSIFMPRWASRITLEITEVRVERLQEITEEDAKAEGCKETRERIGNGIHWESPRGNYCLLWDSINAKRGSWESNPWVWVISFKVV